MPKNKPHKGLLKRVRFTKSGRMKFRRGSGRHLRSHKSGKLLRSYRRPAFATAAERRKVMTMAWVRINATARGEDESSRASGPQPTGE